MKFSCEERWLVLRQMHEVHGMPLSMLATASGKKLSTITNRSIKESWEPDGIESFSLNKITNLIGRLAKITEEKLTELSDGGELSAAADKQIRMISTLVASYNKTFQMIVHLDPNAQSKKDAELDEAGHAGEDILALRTGVEAFIISLGEEEPDPQLSGEAE